MVQCGHAVKAWFKQNGWPQSVPEKWAKATGSEAGPWASQMSHLMNGVHEPKAPFFVALGEFNTAVATRDFDAVTDRRLRDRLNAGKPMCHDNGEPFDAADFFRLYVGHLAVPERYKQAVTYSDQVAAELSAKCREEFANHVKNQMTTRPAAWETLKSHLSGWKHADIERFKEVLCDLGDWTGDEATKQHFGRKHHPAIKALGEHMTNLDVVQRAEEALNNRS